MGYKVARGQGDKVTKDKGTRGLADEAKYAGAGGLALQTFYQSQK